jgi:hypothetical protein
MAKPAKLDSIASLDDLIAGAFTDGATPDTVAALIEETESAERAAGERLQATVSRLRERLTELQTAEEDNRRRAAYEEARAERDELAAELARVYPPLAAQLADLLGRLRASDDRIEHMNAHALPRGCGPLLVAELVARGLDGFVQNSVDRPSSSVAGVRIRYSRTLRVAKILERRGGDPDVTRH